MLPRSYDEKVRTDVHPVGFRLASNSIGEFGVMPVDPKVYTKDGLEQKQRNIDIFEKHCEEHRQKELWTFENRR